MPASPPSPSPRAAWTLRGSHVEFVARAALVRGVRVDLARPAAGLTTGIGDALLGLDLGDVREPADAWIRGDDVTATWDSGDERALHATALWRHRQADPDVAAWDLVASATTARLRADSALAVVSEVAAETLLSAAWHDGRPGPFESAVDAPGRGLWLARRGNGTSCVVMLHPLERQEVTVQRGPGRARIACWLFASGVEKGVLLRSRVLAAVGPAAGDTIWAARLASAFASTPPDLST